MEREAFQIVDSSVLSIPDWKEHHPQLIIGFTTRNGGVSQDSFQSLNLGLHVPDDSKAVIKNRKIVGDKIKTNLSNWVCADQVHDKKIVKVTQHHKGAGVFSYDECISGTDGLYTFEKNVLLALFFADCVPIFFFSPKNSLIGICHAGWRGTAKNIAGEFVDHWAKEEGIVAEEIYAAIGPSIRDCCYVVNDDVLEGLNEVYPLNKSGRLVRQVETGQYAVNLAELNRELLILKGVPDEQIVVSSYCTSCHENLFFSHRRDKGKTGRMMGFIGMKEGM